MKCKQPNCKRNANFGKSGSRIRDWCVIHAPRGSANLNSRKCKDANCNKEPSFGKKGTRGMKNADWCKKHAPKDCVDVVNKKCKNVNCDKRASYTGENSNKKDWCKMHAPKGSDNICSKKCKEPKCKTFPTFGKKGTKIREWCKIHAPKSYVDVANKKCKDVNCYKQPTYGKKGTKIAEVCKDHIPSGSGYVDVRHKSCKKDGCDKRANYGFAGYSEEYCFSHKLPRMISRPRSKPKELTVECQYCLQDIHYNEFFCSGCKRFLELGNTTVKTKQKELEIKTLLEDNDFKFVHDKRVYEGCSLSRPDFLFPVAYGNIILEVDEFQHRRSSYSVECEDIRMRQIYFDCGMPYLLFIRYNPDDFKGNNKISDSKRKEYLLKFLKERLTDKTESGLFVYYLFYNNFNPEEPEFEAIQPYGYGVDL